EEQDKEEPLTSDEEKGVDSDLDEGEDDSVIGSEDACWGDKDLAWKMVGLAVAHGKDPQDPDWFPYTMKKKTNKQTSYSTGSQGSQELLLNIECFLEGQGLLKELNVEELFDALDQTTQALLLHCEHLHQFIDHDVAQIGAQLSAQCFANSDTSKSSETAADDSNIEVTEAIPKDDDVSSAIAATLQTN
ncbi:hypothetical protein H0H87_007451, partial [Tephrocybe sp. NHM501043]